MPSKIYTKPLVNSDATPADELKKVIGQAKTEIEELGTVTVVTLTSAQVLALNTTPITVLAADPAGYAHMIERVEAYKPAGTAYAGIDVAEDIALRYTNGSGTILCQVETTGFLDQATAQTRVVKPAVADFTPLAAAAVVAHMTTGNITTGNQPVSLRIVSRLQPMVF